MSSVILLEVTNNHAHLGHLPRLPISEIWPQGEHYVPAQALSSVFWLQWMMGDSIWFTKGGTRMGRGHGHTRRGLCPVRVRFQEALVNFCLCCPNCKFVWN